MEGACRGPAPNHRRGVRIPYTDIKETVAEYFKIADVVDPDLAEYRKDLLEIFPRRPAAPRAAASGATPSRRRVSSSSTSACWSIAWAAGSTPAIGG